MVIELENKPMTDLVSFEKVDIEPQDPDIQYEDSNPSPSWEVPREDTLVHAVDLQALVLDDPDQNT